MHVVIDNLVALVIQLVAYERHLNIGALAILEKARKEFQEPCEQRAGRVDLDVPFEFFLVVLKDDGIPSPSSPPVLRLSLMRPPVEVTQNPE